MSKDKIRIKISGRGIYGATEELEIGTELEVSHIPPGWRGRVTVLDGKAPEGAVAVTNPAETEEQKRERLIAALSELGIAANANWKTETLENKLAENQPPAAEMSREETLAELDKLGWAGDTTMTDEALASELAAIRALGDS